MTRPNSSKKAPPHKTLRYLPPARLIRYCRRADPPISQQQVAAALRVSPGFITHVWRGRKKLPARHLAALVGLGIPRVFIRDAINPLPRSV